MKVGEDLDTLLMKDDLESSVYNYHETMKYTLGKILYQAVEGNILAFSKKEDLLSILDRVLFENYNDKIIAVYIPSTTIVAPASTTICVYRTHLLNTNGYLTKKYDEYGASMPIGYENLCIGIGIRTAILGAYSE